MKISPLPVGEQYFDSEKMAEFVAAEFPTLVDAAIRGTVPKSSLRRWAEGVNAPSVDNYLRLCAAWNVPLETFLTDEALETGIF